MSSEGTKRFPAPKKNPDRIILARRIQAKAFMLQGERDGLREKSLVVQFPAPRRMLSTTNGFMNAAGIVNHSAPPALWKNVSGTMKKGGTDGGKVYLLHIKKRIARRLGAGARNIAVAGTAADMQHFALVTKEFKPFVVTALVTAGAKNNALRTGVDEGLYIEGEAPKGTVVIFILTNARLTDGAMAGALITITEAKTAAFQDLGVCSSYTPKAQATGTGTDSVMIVSGLTGPQVTYTGGHGKIGELIGKAAHEAVIQALRKHDGLNLVKT